MKRKLKNFSPLIIMFFAAIVFIILISIDTLATSPPPVIKVKVISASSPGELEKEINSFLSYFNATTEIVIEYSTGVAVYSARKETIYSALIRYNKY